MMTAYEAYKGSQTVFCGTMEQAQKYIEGLDGWDFRAIEIPEPTPLADWGRFANTCFENNPFMTGIKTRAIPNEWTIVVAVIQGSTSQTRLLNAIQSLGVVFTNEERQFINETFADCGFTIRIP